MIIDIHAHAFPDELATRAVALLAEHAEVPAHSDGTCAGLLLSMERAGIDRSVVVPIATKPSQVRAINAWSAEISRRYEGLIGFGTLHPEQGDWQDEIDRMVADGIPGIKMHPDYQLFFVDEPRMISIYQMLADAGLVLLFHAGLDIGLPPPIHCTPDRLARVLDAVPSLKVIAAHMGGYSCWDDVDKYLVGRDLWFDTSYSLADLGAERMVSLMRAHGIERILFGTDSPWTDQASEVEGIGRLGLSPDELAAVLGRNAGRLLGILE